MWTNNYNKKNKILLDFNSKYDIEDYDFSIHDILILRWNCKHLSFESNFWLLFTVVVLFCLFLLLFAMALSIYFPLMSWNVHLYFLSPPSFKNWSWGYYINNEHTIYDDFTSLLTVIKPSNFTMHYLHYY